METKPRVLIVDDEEDVRRLLTVVFESSKFEVVADAGNGIAALTMALKHRPDVIVLDFMMPGMTGDEVARQLRSIVPQALIVAFSAVLEAKPDWADAFLDKMQVADVAPLVETLTG